MTQAALKKELEYYLTHQDELVGKYNGKYIVIKGGVVLGAYDDVRTAVDDTAKTHKMGTFLVQRCSPGSKDYTATFRSRVA
jgi:hypothetical protein